MSALASRSSGREQEGAVAGVARLAVDDEGVREPAGLRACAAVGAAAADGLAGEALARVRDAERAVHEYLERVCRWPRGWLRDVVEGELAREDDARGAEGGGELHRARVGAGHLRGGVHRELGGDGAGEAHDGEVLHDDGVDAGGGAGAEGGLDGGSSASKTRVLRVT
jgi:hypothetical protein